MALNFPSSPTTGDTYTDANSVLWQFDGTKWGVLSGTLNKLFNGARLKLTAPIALTTTETAVDWDDEVFDVGNYFTLLSASRLTVPDNAFYRLTCTFFSGTQGSGSSYNIKIVKNGTTTVAESNIAANQAISYDENLVMNAGDYIQVFVSENTASGTILTSSSIEITRIGLVYGQGISPGDGFSGVKTTLSSQVALTSTPTAISWTGTDYNYNADSTGATYWTLSSPTRITVKVTGYYRIKSSIYTSSEGSLNSYTLTLKKNGTTNLYSVDLGPNDTATTDETIQLTANDYIQLLADNSDSVGNITSNSDLELIRIGV